MESFVLLSPDYCIDKFYKFIYAVKVGLLITL